MKFIFSIFLCIPLVIFGQKSIKKIINQEYEKGHFNGTVLYLRYGITSIPSNFLIDPNGLIVAKDLQRDRLQSVLSTIFKD